MGNWYICTGSESSIHWESRLLYGIPRYGYSKFQNKYIKLDCLNYPANVKFPSVVAIL